MVACLAQARAAVLLPLSPSGARISYTVFALGMFPVTGRFERFDGVVTLDPATPSSCRIHVTIDVGSLNVDDADRRRQALGPDMLDAGRFPSMWFDGRCQAHAVTGSLTLHGVTRPLTLALRRQGDTAICTGTIARRDYGIRGMALSVGPRVRVRLTVQLPRTEGNTGVNRALFSTPLKG